MRARSDGSGVDGVGCCGDGEPVGVLRMTAREAIARSRAGSGRRIEPVNVRWASGTMPQSPGLRGRGRIPPVRGPSRGPLGDILVRSPVGAATTQSTTNIVWTPNDATAFGQQTDQLWQALNTSVVSCTSTSGTQQGATSSGSGQGLTSQQFSLFETDYIAWEAFYQKAVNADASSLFGDSFQGLWWNTDTISAYQGKAAAWYNIIQAACPSTTLPTLNPPTPGSFLSNLFPPSADTVKAITVAAVVGTALWFSWPWLAKLRK